MLKLARALAVLIGTVVLLYFADLTLVGWWTDDPMIVRPESIGSAEMPADPAVDDSGSADQAAAMEQLHQTRAYDGLSQWAVATAALAALVILGWYAAAFIKERRTYGPASQRSAWPYWWFLMAAYLAGAIALFFWLIEPMNLVQHIFDLQIYLPTGLVFVLGVIAIWIASVFGIGPVLRPSIPGAARLSRLP